MRKQVYRILEAISEWVDRRTGRDIPLRKALGMHGGDDNLCGCNVNPYEEWPGEIPFIYRRIEELEARLKLLEAYTKVADPLKNCN